MTIIKNSNAFRMIREAADVNVKKIEGPKGRPMAEVAVNGGEVTHVFDHNSRVSKHLEVVSENDLAARLSGGDFFTDEYGQLIDFRYGAYRHNNGFIHTDESINQLSEVVGYTQLDHARNNMTSSNVDLKVRWSNEAVVVDELGEGGEFDTRVTFAWSPFSEHVRSDFDIMRLICTNGMVSTTSLFNNKIPLVNRWEEHLDIANIQIQNKLDDILRRRIWEMCNSRATIAELQLIAEHATSRLDSPAHLMTSDERDRLRTIRNISNPQLHSPGEVYRSNVFDNRHLGAQTAGHLSVFDAWNLLTEMASHTSETSGSSDFALNRMANSLIFDRKDQAEHRARQSEAGCSKSVFSDPDAAFFGTMNTAAIEHSE